MQYIYKTIIPFSDTISKSDFEANYKSQMIEFTDFNLIETAFISYRTYENFKLLIDGVILTWSEVRLISFPNLNTYQYELYLVTNNPIVIL